MNVSAYKLSNVLTFYLSLLLPPIFAFKNGGIEGGSLYLELNAIVFKDVLCPQYRE